MDGFIQLTKFAQAVGEEPNTVRRGVVRGDLAGVQDEHGRWWVSRADYERAIARKGGERDAAIAAEAVPIAYAAFRPTVLQLHLLACQREVLLTSLEADAREAEHGGDAVRAQVARDIVRTMRAASYTWDATSRRWAIHTPDGAVGYSGAPIDHATPARETVS